MRHATLILTALAASSAACVAYTPAQERDFSEFASSRCKNRDGDFIIRGIVSSADEDKVVLSDPRTPLSRVSVTLPGRTPFALVRGVFGTSKHEVGNERLKDLRASHSLVQVTLKCEGGARPQAQEISYANSDGTHAAISF